MTEAAADAASGSGRFTRGNAEAKSREKLVFDCEQVAFARARRRAKVDVKKVTEAALNLRNMPK